MHGTPVESARAGQRVAVNLSGVAVSEAQRGDVLTGARGELTETYRLDCELGFEREPPETGVRVQVHHGTRETPARMTWLGGRFWQLRLETPLIARDGDRLVVRQIAPPDTLGGGGVLDSHPRKHGPGRDLVARLERLSRGEAEPAKAVEPDPVPAPAAARTESEPSPGGIGASRSRPICTRPASPRRWTPSSTPATSPRCAPRAGRCASGATCISIPSAWPSCARS